MRVLFIVLSLVMLIAISAFVVTNLDTRVDVVLLTTLFADAPLYLIVIAALAVGIALAGVLAIVEGAHIRISNRRLAREVHRLETELHYLRTQPRRGETNPDTPTGTKTPGKAAPEAEDVHPSAPVYSGDTVDPDDDDTYSGGRAV